MFLLLKDLCNVSTRDVKNKEQSSRYWAVGIFLPNLILL